MQQMFDRFLALCGRAYGRWRAIKERWTYVAALSLLSVIFAGPRQFLADRIEDLNAVISIPDHLWGKWLVIFLAIAIIAYGILRSEKITKAVTERETKIRLDALSVPIAEISNFGMIRKVAEAERIREQYKNSLAQYEGYVTLISEASEIRQHEFSFGYLQFFEMTFGGFSILKTAALLLNDQCREPNMIHYEMNFIGGEKGHPMGCRMTQKSKDELETACRHNLEQLRDNLGWLDYAITKKRDLLKSEAERLL